MAPRITAQRRSQSQNEHIYDLGVRGRKTGVFLKDSGVRDEHGMQPLEDIFSSPEKENRRVIEDDDDESDEEDMEMDIDETTGPAPSAFMNARNGVQLPIPRGRSPPKTYLQSPAIKNPTLGPSSSPARGSVVRPRGHSPSQSVKRRLDFGMQPLSAAKLTTNGKKSHPAKSNSVTNGHRSYDDEQEESANDEESMAILDAGVDDYVAEDEPQEEPVEETQSEEEEVELAPKPAAAGRRGRPKKNVIEEEPAEDEPEPVVEQELTPDESDEPIRAGRKRGRPAKGKEVQDGDVAEKPAKRARSGRNPSPGAESETATAKESKKGPTRKPGRAKTADSVAEGESSKAAKGTKKGANTEKTKRGRKRQSPGVGEASFVEPPRGPPIPKSRGLMIRRETPGAASGMFQTRSGRNSYRPLAFWKNEHVEHDGGDVLDDGKAHILLPSIKEIVRVEEPEDDRPAKRKGRAGRTAGKKSKRQVYEEESDDDNVEPWEVEPGVVAGEVIMWNPEHEFNPPALDEEVEVGEEQLAIAGSAIETRDIRNASFRFAKTLSMPFFGSGVVDLPPGAEKRPKNSRKMHMTFFVFTGRVKVTVAETEFRIGKGGMWFVPRGNYYSIENDYDQPSRIFFAQGCEVNTAPSGPGEQSMMA